MRYLKLALASIIAFFCLCAVALAAPTNQTKPVISGNTQVGSVLTTTTGKWSGTPTYTFQWRDCTGTQTKGDCTNIPGATNQTYTLQQSDLGDELNVKVTATGAGGSSASVSSANTAVVTGGTQSAGKVVTFWLGWSGTIQESQIPWNDVNQVDLFSLYTQSSGSTTTLEDSSTGISNMNVPAWVSMIHSHGDQAFISIGGSSDGDWPNACQPANLASLETQLDNFATSNGFNGIDIDIESLQGGSPLWAPCVEGLSNAAHQAGLLVSTDIDESWMDQEAATFATYPDQFNLMYYGYPTGNFSCANSCAQPASMVSNFLNTTGVPASKTVLGFSPGGGQAQSAYVNLDTTSASVNTSGAVTSIPLASALSAAIPAGNVVLATGENPPNDYQVFSTPGAAQGATSITVNSPVLGNGPFVFPSGSELQSDYKGPWDCGNMARYAASQNLGGVMIWDLQEEYAEHNGSFPCYDQAELGLQ